MIIELEIALQPHFQSRHRGVLLRVQVFVLYRPPQSFHEDVIEHPASAIHAEPDTSALQGRGEGSSDTSPDLVVSIFEYDRSKNPSLLREHDVRIEIVPGFFEGTLPDSLPSQIAFLHVDSDLYDSTKVVLERCLPRLSSGGIVIVDEYQDERWPGAKKATDEIIKRFGLNVEYFDVIRRYGVRVP